MPDLQGPATFKYGYEPLGSPLPGFMRTQEAEASFLSLTTAHVGGHCATLTGQSGTGQASLLQVSRP